VTTTKIAERDVPLETGPKTIIRFSGGRGGPSEAGEWEFWAAICPEGKAVARCRLDADPGERFRRMEGTPGYERSWAIARAADRLRPATAGELGRWLDRHPGDALHAETGEVRGEKIRVENERGRYRVIPEAC
jgi:hypothetical protein